MAPFCAALNCSNSKLKRPELSFFRFPREVERSKRWVINCRRADLDHKTTEELNKYYYLCSEHFESNQFTNVLHNWLNWKAVPTLFKIFETGMNGIKLESDDRFHSMSASSNGSSLTCCLIDNGLRCAQATGNASYSKRIAKMVQQRRLKLSLDHTAKHIYICDEHKNTIQHIRSQQKSRDLPRAGEVHGDPASKSIHSEINFFLLPVNLLRRYKRHFKLPTRPGINKAQLADIVCRHFVKMPVNEKEILTYFLYMCKNSSKNRLDSSGMASTGGGADLSN